MKSGRCGREGIGRRGGDVEVKELLEEGREIRFGCEGGQGVEVKEVLEEAGGVEVKEVLEEGREM